LKIAYPVINKLANDIALIHKIKHISTLHHEAAERGWATVTKEKLIFLTKISKTISPSKTFSPEKEAAGNCCISYPIFTILADKIALIYIAAKRILLIRVARKAMVTKQKLKKLFAFFPGRCKSTVKHVVNLGEEALGVLHSQSEIQLFIKF